ncbi:MAG TPA: 16S rRNA (guanine(966)-N(2))-methyltransferase RsmD [bacterium]|nr:16S rRNA (guanine(966)-N(2))-methyltransferase RsmD [bacterium]
MRVIAGKYRNREVKPPKGEKIRPTADKVKGALFNMLEPLRDSAVADFYAGTGNLGIEALSRGASSVCFVDNGREGLALIRENLASLKIAEGPMGPARVLALDVAQAFFNLHQEKRLFDIILADPPYEKGALKRLQNLLMKHPILKPGGVLAVEHGSQDLEMDPAFPHALSRQKKYGDTYLSLFKSGE